jgi:hypothetical protein
MKKSLVTVTCLALLLSLASFSHLLAAELSTGGSIVVPAYRSFYQIYGTTRDSYALTNTFFFYNIDPKQPIEILSIDFFDSTGKLLKKLIDTPLAVPPGNSKEITLQPRSHTEEDCATYLKVMWKSNRPANTPLVEVVMVGQVMNRGISFTSRGVEVKEEPSQKN